MEETAARRVRRPPLACDRPRLVVLPLPRPGVVPAARPGRRAGHDVRRPGPADVGAAEVGGPADPGDPGRVAAATAVGVTARAGAEPGTGDEPGDRAGDGAGVGTGVDPPPGSARVELAAGGHQVVVEAPEPLDRVAAVAMKLWVATDDPDLVRGFGFGASAGEPVFTEVPWDVPAPRHLTEPEGPDETVNIR